MDKKNKIAFGGGCHWCTEAVFQSIQVVLEVEQGYVASSGKATSFSEGVIVKYLPEIISLKTLIEIHLRTHNATSNHSFREKYRSAVYYLNPGDNEKSRIILEQLQEDLEEKIIIRVLPFQQYKPSRESLQNYYRKNPDKPFRQRYIDPKLNFLRENFRKESKILKE